MAIKLKNGHKLQLDLELPDLFDAKRRGRNIIDLQQITKLGSDDLFAMESAFHLYRPRLEEMGIDNEDAFYKAVPREKVSELIEAFREEVSFFSPVLARYLRQIKAEMDKAMSAAETNSGNHSGNPQDLWESTHEHSKELMAN